MNGVVSAVRCNLCSRQLPAWRTHHFGTPAAPAQRICDDCLDWHVRALDLLAGRGIPPGCQRCGETAERLRDSSPGVEWRLYVVPDAGLYKVLCSRCVLPYTSQRRDLYRGTAFGHHVLNL